LAGVKKFSVAFVKQDKMLRLISWNISWQSKASPHDRIAALIQHAPDVVALQEVRIVDAYVLELRDTDLREQCGLQFSEGLGLLVALRWPIQRLGSVMFRIPDEV
jgi:endonuclease/exonuclease/phosphatase family metal-dependent hydrolase